MPSTLYPLMLAILDITAGKDSVKKDFSHSAVPPRAFDCAGSGNFAQVSPPCRWQFAHLGICREVKRPAKVFATLGFRQSSHTYIPVRS